MGFSEQRTRHIATALAAACLLLALVFASRAAAAPLLAIDRVAHVVPKVETLEDPGKVLSFEEVSKNDVQFGPQGLPPNVGYSRSAYWIRFSLENPTPRDERVLLEFLRTTDRIDLYERRVDGVRHRVGGSALPYAAREVPDADHVFRLGLAAREQIDLWVRFESADTLDLTPQVWSEPAYQAHSRTEGMVGGLYFGLILALVVYNSFIFLSTRASPYGFYVLFQLLYAGMVAAFDRYSFQYLWPNSPRWAAQSEIVFGAGALVFGALFARSFLDLPTLAPRLARATEIIAAVAAALATLGLFGSHTWLQQTTLFFASCAVPGIILIGAAAWLKKSPNAPYYTVAYGLLGLGTIVDTIESAGLAAHDANITLWLRVGSGAEALLLAFGLANRINLIQREKDRTASELAESRKVYAETLEQRVADRTRELAAALENLETAERELAQRERLAALGRTVAGVAHEVMNPLNFAVGGAAKVRTELERVAKLLAKPMSDGSDDAEARTACQTAERALSLVEAGNQRIASIVESLKGYLTLGRVAPEPKDVNEELERALTLAADELAKSGVTIEKRLRALPLYPCSNGELGQVFLNLLTNARQAMPDGGTLTVTSAASEDGIRISVEDTGPGVPPEHRRAIFEPFFTTRPPGQGTGLGLSLSHEIVERHGGRLELVPSDHGAEFRISFPLPPRDG
jgi:signal transduction histidine kinase